MTTASNIPLPNQSNQSNQLKKPGLSSCYALLAETIVLILRIWIRMQSVIKTKKSHTENESLSARLAWPQAILKTENSLRHTDIPGTILIRAASIGETQGALQFLISAFPHGGNFLLTVNTLSGLQKAQNWISAHPNFGLRARLAWLDAPKLNRAWLTAEFISAIFLYEGEMWPSLLETANSLAIPVHGIAMRWGLRGLRAYPILLKLFPHKPFATIQYREAGFQGIEKWNALSRSQPQPGPDYKAAPLAQQLKAIKPTGEPWEHRDTIAFLSMHPKEFLALLPSIQSLSKNNRIVVQFRHRNQAEKFLKSFSKPLHSPLAGRKENPDSDSDIKVTQTESLAPQIQVGGMIWNIASPDSTWPCVFVLEYGTSSAICARAHLACIGGSWIPKGGHSPWEAVQAGCQVRLGPFHEAQSDGVALLFRLGLKPIVATLNGLATHNKQIHSPWPTYRVLGMALAERIGHGARQAANQIRGNPAIFTGFSDSSPSFGSKKV